MRLELKEIKKIVIASLMRAAGVNDEIKVKNHLESKEQRRASAAMQIPPGISRGASMAGSLSRRSSMTDSLAVSLPKQASSITSKERSGAADKSDTVSAPVTYIHEFTEDDVTEIVRIIKDASLMAAKITKLTPVKDSNSSTGSLTTIEANITSSESTSIIDKSLAIAYLSFIHERLSLLDILALAYVVQEQRIIDALIIELQLNLIPQPVASGVSATTTTSSISGSQPNLKGKTLGPAATWAHESIIRALIDNKEYEKLALFLEENNNYRVQIDKDKIKKCVSHCVIQRDPEALKIILQYLDQTELSDSFFNEVWNHIKASKNNQLIGIFALFCSLLEKFGTSVGNLVNTKIQHVAFFGKANITPVNWWLDKAFEYDVSIDYQIAIMDDLFPFSLKDHPEKNRILTSFKSDLMEQNAKMKPSQTKEIENLLAVFSEGYQSNSTESSVAIEQFRAANILNGLIFNALQDSDFRMLDVICSYIKAKEINYINLKGTFQNDKFFEGEKSFTADEMVNRIKQLALVNIESNLQSGNVKQKQALSDAALTSTIFQDAEHRTALRNLLQTRGITSTAAQLSR